ncbi:MAG: hypothetical protein V1723_02715 [Candidatus Uhrbacteria bacterium]
MSRTRNREQPDDRLAARQERDPARFGHPERPRSRRAKRLWFVLTGDHGQRVYATVPLRLIADADDAGHDYRSLRVEDALQHLDRLAHHSGDVTECDQECCRRWSARLVDVASANVGPAEGYGSRVRGQIDGGALLLEDGIWVNPDLYFELGAVIERLGVTGAIYVMVGTEPVDDRDLSRPIPGVQLLLA